MQDNSIDVLQRLAAMTVFTVPKSGLVLDDSCKANTSDKAKTLVQVMQLDLADGTIDELFKCARKGNPIHVAFGKTIVRYSILI